MFARATLLDCIGKVVCATSVVGLTWIGARYFRRRKDCAVENPVANISVPEILGVLGKGPKELKPVVLRALLPILHEEVDIFFHVFLTALFYEIIDEAQGVHNTIPREGNLFDVLLRDLEESATSKYSEEIVAFFLICTWYDSAWGDDDQWNALVVGVISLLRLKNTKQIEQCIARGIPLKRVLERIEAQSQKDVTHPEMPPLTFGEAKVDLMSFNTRVKCADCGNVVSPSSNLTVTCSCENATYCSADHQRNDMNRHQQWCFLNGID